MSNLDRTLLPTSRKWVADPGVLLTGPVKILAPTDAVRRPTTRHVVLEAEVADPGSAGFTVNVLGVPPLWADVSPGPYSLQSGPFRVAHLEAKESGPPLQKDQGLLYVLLLCGPFALWMGGFPYPTNDFHESSRIRP